MTPIQYAKQRLNYWHNIKQGLEDTLLFTELGVDDKNLLTKTEREQLPKIIYSIEHMLLTVERAYVTAFSDYMIEKESEED